jgi:hypothetical protein
VNPLISVGYARSSGPKTDPIPLRLRSTKIRVLPFETILADLLEAWKFASAIATEVHVDEDTSVNFGMEGSSVVEVRTLPGLAPWALAPGA